MLSKDYVPPKGTTNIKINLYEDGILFTVNKLDNGNGFICRATNGTFIVDKLVDDWKMGDDYLIERTSDLELELVKRVRESYK